LLLLLTRRHLSAIFTLSGSEQYGHAPKSVSKLVRDVGRARSHSHRHARWNGLPHLGFSHALSGASGAPPPPPSSASRRYLERARWVS